MAEVGLGTIKAGYNFANVCSRCENSAAGDLQRLTYSFASGCAGITKSGSQEIEFKNEQKGETLQNEMANRHSLRNVCLRLRALISRARHHFCDDVECEEEIR